MEQDINLTTGTIYKPSNPWVAKVIENTRITDEKSPDDIRHILIETRNSGINLVEGQSIGIIVPGVDENGKKHRVRLYSVSSPREGDISPDILALTVKRVFFKDEETGEIVKGLASNYICDLKAGDDVTITGPVGRTFLLPDDPETDIIMIAVGTGIAPFRAFIHHLYHKGNPEWKGRVRLFFGAKSGMENLYMNDENNDIGQYYTMETFKEFSALSKGSNPSYVQHKLRDNIEEIWSILERNHFSLYICGLQGIEVAVNEVFHGIAIAQDLNWDILLDQYKKEKRWHVEVY